MIQQAAPIPAIKAGCFTTSEICWDRGFCEVSGPDIRPDASEDDEDGNDCRKCESRIRKDFLNVYLGVQCLNSTCEMNTRDNKRIEKPKTKPEIGSQPCR